jgi:hypothetical protein
MGADKFQPVADVVALEGAKLLPPVSAWAFYGLTLEKWVLVLPALYYLVLLVDLVARRWLVPLVRSLRSRSASAPSCGVNDDAD